MKTLAELTITQPYIALFGSGTSIHELSEADWSMIRSQAFVFTTNYAPVHLSCDLNMWSDRRVSNFLQKHYNSHEKDCLFLVRENKAGSLMKNMVDFTFDPRKEKIKGNYTIVWALQLLKKYFPHKTVLLFGVDMYAETPGEDKWIDRYTDFDKRERGKRYDIHAKLDQCTRQIVKYCPAKHVINCNPKSRLAHFPKTNWRTLLKMNILHLCCTPLAGAPVHLSKIINKYTPHQSKAILKKPSRSPNHNRLNWPYDFISPSKKELEEAISWADVIHYHRKVYPVEIKNKASLLQFHSPPKGYLPEEHFAEFNGRKLVIAQYHPRFYTDAHIVPNLIDIWDPELMTEEKDEDQIVIYYSWATEVKGSWSDKGSSPTQKILNQIKQKYGFKVQIEVMHNRPYQECLAAKRKAHICIDECVTGSYHLSSLEGCAVGAVTFNNIDDQTVSFMEAVTGQSDHPFVKATLDELYEKICLYIENPEKLIQQGKAARAWMEKYWNPEVLINRYIQAYSNLLLYNSVLPKEVPKVIKAHSPKSELVAPTRKKAVKVSKRPASVIPKSHSLKSIGRPITELYQKYAGKDIYIFGTGPSLFEVDPKEYEDKICFGINFAFEVVPCMNYTFVHVIEAYEAIQPVLDNNTLVLPETLVRQWYRESYKNKKPTRIASQNAKAMVYPIQNPYERNLKKKHVNIAEETKFFTWSTTSHSAIHIAAYAGAQNIYLIGMDYRLYPNGKVHFDSKHSELYGSQNWHALKKHQQGDLWLQRQLTLSGVSLINYSNHRSEVGPKLMVKA